MGSRLRVVIYCQLCIDDQSQNGSALTIVVEIQQVEKHEGNVLFLSVYECLRDVSGKILIFRPKWRPRVLTYAKKGELRTDRFLVADSI